MFVLLKNPSLRKESQEGKTRKEVRGRESANFSTIQPLSYCFQRASSSASNRKFRHLKWRRILHSQLETVSMLSMTTNKSGKIRVEKSIKFSKRNYRKWHRENSHQKCPLFELVMTENSQMIKWMNELIDSLKISWIDLPTTAKNRQFKTVE